MKVKIKVFAGLQSHLGSDEVMIKGNDVREVLEKLSEKSGQIEDDLWKKDNRKELKDNIIIMMNGRNLNYLDGISTKVKDGDKISIFPMVGGG